MEDILENHQETDHWFHSIRKWNNSETCATRTWIEVFGVPPQAWTRKNFGSIAKHWGTFVSLGKNAETTTSFESMLILIDTGSMNYIHGAVLVSIEDSYYRVFVKEKGSEVHIIH